MVAAEDVYRKETMEERFTSAEFQEMVKVSRERIRQWRVMGLPYIIVDETAKRKTFEYTRASLDWVEKRRQGRQ